MGMTELRRIRVDRYGLLTQDGRGRMARVFLEADQIRSIEQDPERGVQALAEGPVGLASFHDGADRLAARLDLALEPSDCGCLSRPLRIYYNLEPRCNLRCAFCGPRDLRHESARATAQREALLLQEIARAGTFQVQLTGGEIFLRGWRLFRTLEQTATLGLATLLGTNGVWDHVPRRAEFLRRLGAFNHIIEVKISIDGTREFHDAVRGRGTYDAAVRTLFDLAGSGFVTRINTTIFKESCTAEQIEHVARLAKAAGAGLQAIPERSCGRSGGKQPYQLPDRQALSAYTRRATELREELGVPISFNFDILGGGRSLPVYDPDRPFSCGAGLWGFAVTHLGEVYPCGFSMDIGDPPVFLAGVISEQSSLLDIWLNSPVLRAWRHAGKPRACQTCSHYRQTCWGGCMVQAYVVNGALNAADPYCIRDVTVPASAPGNSPAH